MTKQERTGMHQSVLAVRGMLEAATVLRLLETNVKPKAKKS